MKYSVEMSIAAEPSQWATKGYIQAAYDYPFFQMNREKVIATVLTDNSKSIEMLTRLGHTNEGCLKDYQGVDKDCYIYGITKRQYLAGKYVPKQRQEQYECNK
jgi:RimJ/RimL family protein N-acetyltransferase